MLTTEGAVNGIVVNGSRTGLSRHRAFYADHRYGADELLRQDTETMRLVLRYSGCLKGPHTTRLHMARLPSREHTHRSPINDSILVAVSEAQYKCNIHGSNGCTYGIVTTAILRTFIVRYHM